MSERIKLAFPRGETLPENIFSDMEWLREQRQKLYETYGACVVAIYQKKILAVAQGYDEALAKLEENLPETPEIITPIIEFVGNSHRIAAVRKKSSQE
jgi:hypothetical protein